MDFFGGAILTGTRAGRACVRSRRMLCRPRIAGEMRERWRRGAKEAPAMGRAMSRLPRKVISDGNAAVLREAAGSKGLFLASAAPD